MPRFPLRLLGAAALAALGLASAAPAQAGEFGVTFGFGAPRPVYDGYDPGYRPVRRFYDDGLHARPRYPGHRRIVERRVFEDDDEECRVIVRRRYNAFGDLVVRRTRVCD